MKNDTRRFLKQIQECRQILSAIYDPTRGYANHPVTKMYKDHTDWLNVYLRVFEFVRSNNLFLAWSSSLFADKIRPEWMTDELCNQHKRRLYTKAPHRYTQFAELGESLENWYIVSGELKKYINGKIILQNKD